MFVKCSSEVKEQSLPSIWHPFFFQGCEGLQFRKGKKAHKDFSDGLIPHQEPQK